VRSALPVRGECSEISRKTLEVTDSTVPESDALLTHLAPTTISGEQYRSGCASDSVVGSVWSRTLLQHGTMKEKRVKGPTISPLRPSLSQPCQPASLFSAGISPGWSHVSEHLRRCRIGSDASGLFELGFDTALNDTALNIDTVRIATNDNICEGTATHDLSGVGINNGKHCDREDRQMSDDRTGLRADVEAYSNEVESEPTWPNACLDKSLTNTAADTIHTDRSKDVEAIFDANGECFEVRSVPGPLHVRSLDSIATCAQHPHFSEVENDTSGDDDEYFEVPSVLGPSRTHPADVVMPHVHIYGALPPPQIGDASSSATTELPFRLLNSTML
jgi:hypothetical protein